MSRCGQIQIKAKRRHEKFLTFSLKLAEHKWNEQRKILWDEVFMRKALVVKRKMFLKIRNSLVSKLRNYRRYDRIQLTNLGTTVRVSL